MVSTAATMDDAGLVVARAAGGDVIALASIVARHHQDMARVCAVICCDPDLADDAVQAAWPIAWKRLGSLRDPDRLRPWLISIAANEARQLLRRERRRKVIEIRIANDAPDHAETTARRVDLAAVLARLHPDERALLALRFVSGASSDEIGAALGMSASGARSRLERLLDRLRKELGDVE